MNNEILFITSFPPRECGIATYSQDLIKMLNSKFNKSFDIQICALESTNEKHTYPIPIKYVLNVDMPLSYTKLAKDINSNEAIQIVVIQHEFGFFEKKESHFLQFLDAIQKPIITVFHTILPRPNEAHKIQVRHIAIVSKLIIVMTQTSKAILKNDYGIPLDKIAVIPHGTHLVTGADKEMLKQKYKLSGKKILATFGLLSSGKSIETTLAALPAIIKQNPDVLFLVIGKTHPSVAKQEGELYRQTLAAKVTALRLENHVIFINQFLPLPDLLEYLQLTDIYLFTSKDPNQAVSGTFSYAISCGCPIISTPIPHALEILKDDVGIIIDFENAEQLSKAAINLLNDDTLRKNISSNCLHKMASTAWENAAIAHAIVFKKVANDNLPLHYKAPPINFTHLKKMTTSFGIVQFAKINQPDMDSGYTLDDNARAMVAICQHFELTKDKFDLPYLKIYLHFIKYCLQPENYFLNYVNEAGSFTPQNHETNLADANGRAIWALGYLISISDSLPAEMADQAAAILRTALLNVNHIYSTRAMAFVIKGLYYANTHTPTAQNIWLIVKLTNRLVQMYKHEASKDWTWYESYLTYANSILPEAMLCAWLATGEPIYKHIAKTSFDFLLSKIFTQKSIKVISNKGWLHKNEQENITVIGGEQPIDVAYTVLALSKFYETFGDENYKQKMDVAFEWFLGNNHLHQIIYNPCTGGCYDGLEESYVNLNQGAESTVSYLMARLTIEKTFQNKQEVRQSVLVNEMCE